MCKLYALQTTMTQTYAKRVISEKMQIIGATERHGFGIALHVDGVTRTWQCGEALSDSVGEDVTSGLNGHLRMATLILHGRTSTSGNKTVEHSHPRPTANGVLMHNGVVEPISKLGWKMDYDLDSDYLAELEDRDELGDAESYLNGYAGVLVLRNDGKLIVQNQGANLRMLLENDCFEFGTTEALCNGTPFDLMRAEAFDCNISIKPIESMTGRIKKFDNVTNIGVTPATQTRITFPSDPKVIEVSSERTGRTMLEIGINPNKKGRLPEEKAKEMYEEFDLDWVNSRYSM